MTLHEIHNGNSQKELDKEYPENAENKSDTDVPDDQIEKPEDIIKKLSRVIERSNWAARAPKSITMLKTPVKKVVLTWTETEQCKTEEECIRRVQEIQLNHLREEGIPDIKHNFLLGGDGALYEGRGFTRVGPTYSANVDEQHTLTGESIEIAFIDKNRNQPSPTLLKVLSECLAFGVDGKIIEPKFTMYWMSENDVVYVQPHMLTCGHKENK